MDRSRYATLLPSACDKMESLKFNIYLYFEDPDWGLEKKNKG